MNFLQLAKERYSVRKFSDKKVEKEKLDLILEAGRAAPTAVNYQPQRILVLDSEENLVKLKVCTPYHFNAPLALLVCYDSTVSWKRSYDKEDMGVVDASIVTTQMMLQIAELGLGSTWVGHFNPYTIRESFKLPEYLVPVAILPIGYPRQDSVPHPKLHENRYDIKDTVFFNSFEGIAQGKNNEGQHDPHK
jgi:nitroreductase